MKPQFQIKAISDKILTPNGIRYLTFFDFDGELTEEQRRSISNLRLIPFKTRNGYHLIGPFRVDAQLKKDYFEAMQERFPSDYKLANVNWLAPHSQAEEEYIKQLLRRFNAEALYCKYYRDKAVFETYV